jgi:hypothetical protein
VSDNHLNLSETMQVSLVFAARYAHHRNTGAALLVTTAVKQCWHKLDKRTKEQILRESHEATFNFEDWNSLRVFASEKGKDNE